MAATSPFSFHCIVCFEEFEQEERYPVVLPCGHTYLCIECARRLDKCMECRTSLSIILPSQSTLSIQKQGSASGAAWSSARSGGRAASIPSRAAENVPSKASGSATRLPLPKNIVLLSLMEATALTVSDLPPSPFSSPIKQSISLDQYDVEEEKIRVGTSMAIGMCGTYVISSKSDVIIFPSRPTKPSGDFAHNRSTSEVPEEEDVDNLVRFFHMDSQLEIKSGNSLKDSDEEIRPHAPLGLKRGDRVQIVSLEEGWAKLARGYGFIRADAGQVVKGRSVPGHQESQVMLYVLLCAMRPMLTYLYFARLVGGSVDRACRLEAMLRTLAGRRRSLQKEQRELDSQFVTLMRDLQYSLMEDEDLTVIGADTFKDVGKEAVPLSYEEKPLVHSEQEDHDLLIKAHRLERQPTPPVALQAGLGCFNVPDVFDAFGEFGTRRSPLRISVPHRRDHDMFDNIMGVCSSGDENSIIDHSGFSFPDDIGVDRNRHYRQPQPYPSPRSLSAGARAWRESNGRQPSRGIDFRTGLSGHMALSSAHAHTHEDIRAHSTRSKMSMSSHSGLNLWAPSRKAAQTTPSFSSLEVPVGSSVSSEPATTRAQEETKEDVLVVHTSHSSNL